MARRNGISPNGANEKDISRTADEMTMSVSAQLRSVELAINGTNEMTTSLKQTAEQAESVTSSSQELAASINELAASTRDPSRVVGLHFFTDILEGISMRRKLRHVLRQAEDIRAMKNIRDVIPFPRTPGHAEF
jgi:hypothetical protein